MMLYEVNDEREEAFENGATFMHDYYAPKLKKAIEALEFYASLSTWGTDMPDTRTAVDPSDHERVRLSMGAPDIRGGKRARQALAELSEVIK